LAELVFTLAVFTQSLALFNLLIVNLITFPKHTEVFFHICAKTSTKV